MRLWPLLARAIRPFCSPVMTVGFYCPIGKLSDGREFLKQTICHLTTLLNEGIKIGNDAVTVPLASAVCNTTAVAFIRQAKSPGGCYGCDKCILRGQYCDKRVTYPNVKSKLREIFRK